MAKASATAAKQNGNRGWLAAIPYAWLFVFFFVPFVLVVKISLSQTALAIPPYQPTIDWSAGIKGITDFFSALNFNNYIRLTGDSLYIKAYLSSLQIATFSTIMLLLVGYPIAYGMAKAPADMRSILLMLVILPFWTSFLIRVYAWIGILKPEGLLNAALIGIGVVSPDNPLEIMNTDTAVYIGIVYSYLPFMVLPLYSALEKLDGTLLEAASDLGCPPWKAFWLVTWPLSLPGVIAGSMLCFIPIMGEFVIPDLLGGAQTLMIGRTIWVEFFNNRDWPVASAVAVLLLITLILPIVIYQQQQAKVLEAER
jgi:putrescine transport system permease protein